MSLMTSRGTLDLLTLTAVREMFTTGVEERSGELIYSRLGFQDNTPIKPDQQTKGVSGPGRGLLVVEGEDHKANQLYPSYPVTTLLNEYTSVLSYTRDDVHWLEMAIKSGDTLNNFGDIVEDAVNAVQENINDDAAAALYLGYGTTRINVGNNEALTLIALLKSFLIDLKNQLKIIGQQGASKLKKLCSVNVVSEKTPDYFLWMGMRYSELGL